MRTPPQFSIKSILIANAIIALICAHFAMGFRAAPYLIAIEFGVVFLTPVWLTPILMFQAPATARRFLKGMVIIALLVTVPSCLGAATDRFPFQFESIFLLVSSYWLTLSFGLGYLTSRFRNRSGKTRIKRRTSS